MIKYMAVFLGMLMMAMPVLAAVDAGIIIGDPGALPNSWTYGFKKFSESLQLMFTFNEVNKAELQYQFALRRLAEADKMAQLGDTEKSNKLMNEYEIQLGKATQTMTTAQQNGKDISQLQLQIQTQEQVRNQIGDAVVAQIQTQTELQGGSGGNGGNQ